MRRLIIFVVHSIPFYSIPLTLISFHYQMINNYTDIKRAMMSFDDDGCGFIRIDDLKAVVDNFVLQMSEENFQKIMYK